MTDQTKSPFLRRPNTRTGWWAVGLMVGFLILFMINSVVWMRLPETEWGPVVLPFYGIFMLLVGLAAGVVGLIALLQKRERSWLVWLTILPAAFVILMLLGEFLFPH